MSDSLMAKLKASIAVKVKDTTKVSRLEKLPAANRFMNLLAIRPYSGMTLCMTTQLALIIQNQTVNKTFDL